MTDPKPLLRNEMKRRRAMMASANPLAGEQLAQSVSAAFDAGEWPDVRAVISGYYPIQSEINPFPLLQAFQSRGHALCLPALVPSEEGFRMIFRRFSIGDSLILGPFDIRQPIDSAEEIDPDIVLLPMLAFDRQGRRLGYGGGYYDRALEALRSRKAINAVGIAFSGQELAEIPFEVHDQPIDVMFTELGLVGAEPIV